MPYALISIGILLVIAGARNKTSELGELVGKDFAGSNSFFYWAVAIGLVGSVGYVKKAETVSRAFLVLIIVVMFLKNGSGFMARLNEALGSIGAPTPSGEKDVGAASNDIGVEKPFQDKVEEKVFPNGRPFPFNVMPSLPNPFETPLGRKLF